MFDEISLLILDVDGCLTKDKGYTIQENNKIKITKFFNDHDFTFIKAFKAKNVEVVCVTGDKWNFSIIDSRKMKVYSSEDYDGMLCKEKLLPQLEQEYNTSRNTIGFVGDDIFDIPLMKLVKYPFCPRDASLNVKHYLDNRFQMEFDEYGSASDHYILRNNSGCGIIEEIYMKFFGYLTDADIEKIKLIDMLERKGIR